MKVKPMPDESGTLSRYRAPAVGKWFKHLFLSIVLMTLFIGQVTMLEEVGALEGVVDVYLVAQWALMLYAFWPPITYLTGLGHRAIVQKLRGGV